MRQHSLQVDGCVAREQQALCWMRGYQCDDEQAYGGGSYVKEGNVPHEALNFLPIEDTYYGFVENLRQQIRLKRLGGQTGDTEINGVSVVFCATDRKTNDFLVTGWYPAATVPISLQRMRR